MAGWRGGRRVVRAVGAVGVICALGFSTASCSDGGSSSSGTAKVAGATTTVVTTTAPPTTVPPETVPPTTAPPETVPPTTVVAAPPPTTAAPKPAPRPTPRPAPAPPRQVEQPIPGDATVTPPPAPLPPLPVPVVTPEMTEAERQAEWDDIVRSIWSQATPDQRVQTCLDVQDVGLQVILDEQAAVERAGGTDEADVARIVTSLRRLLTEVCPPAGPPSA